MKFVCERCHTKYSIADEKVRGKVLKVRCKTCENVITVRETGATIDDAGSGVPKEAPLTRSGTLDARTGDSSAIGVGPAGRRVNPEAGRRSAPSLPAAALVDPHGPAVAPPHRPTPRPMPALSVDDGVEWYLAVDGAQTGPFRRPVLIDKILAVPPGGDIHVWNANLGAWKPPKDVPDVSADLARRRRPSAVSSTGNVRRPSGAMPIIAPRPVPTEISEGHSGSNGVSAFGESEDTQISAGPPVPWKRNGVGPAASAKGASKPGFGLEDMFGGDGEHAAATAAPALAAAASSPAVPAAAASSVSVPVVAPGARVGGRPVRLIFGAVALAVIVCGIVAVVMLRKPAAPVAVTPKPAPSGETNFANLAEKLANEQAAEKPAEPPPPPPVVDEKPLVAKVDGPARNAGGNRGKNHGRNRGGTGPGTSPTAPPPLTEEQQRAAARFGESSTREVRAPSGGGAAAHSMPAQADISRVINNNRQGIQTCYQRALLRDSTLTQGKVTVRVSIGISGKVKSVSLDAPPQFRSMESCVRDVMSRWAFPPSSEEYGTEFPVVLQGNQ
jgi:predicted Zn finger-like uncharacterized protein